VKAAEAISQPLEKTEVVALKTRYRGADGARVA
jgi:hypothetical protein